MRGAWLAPRSFFSYPLCNMPIVAIVPAAGLSSRMGGPNKLLMPWGDGTVVGSVVAALIKSGLEVVVVTGRDASHVAEAVDCPTVFNPAFAEGLGGSIAAGAGAAPSADGYLIALGDMPEVSPRVIRALMEAFASKDDILAPVYESGQGHPVLFGAAYFEELCALKGDVGARSILAAHRDRLRLIPVDGELQDLDQLADFDRGDALGRDG